MSNIAKIIILISFFFSESSFAQQKVVVDQNYLKRMEAAKLQIKKQLESTNDPVKKHELILKLKKIDDAYYNPLVRTEMIKKTRPGYAARVKAYNSLTSEQRKKNLIKAEVARIAINPEIRGSIAERWDNVPDWEKKIHCDNTLKECFAGGELKCRFILDRCYNFVERDTFKKVRSVFSPIAR